MLNFSKIFDVFIAGGGENVENKFKTRQYLVGGTILTIAKMCGIIKTVRVFSLFGSETNV